MATQLGSDQGNVQAYLSDHSLRKILCHHAVDQAKRRLKVVESFAKKAFLLCLAAMLGTNQIAVPKLVAHVDE